MCASKDVKIRKHTNPENKSKTLQTWDNFSGNFTFLKDDNILVTLAPDGVRLYKMDGDEKNLIYYNLLLIIEILFCVSRI